MDQSLNKIILKKPPVQESKWSMDELCKAIDKEKNIQPQARIIITSHKKKLKKNILDLRKKLNISTDILKKSEKGLKNQKKKYAEIIQETKNKEYELRKHVEQLMHETRESASSLDRLHEKLLKQTFDSHSRLALQKNEQSNDKWYLKGLDNLVYGPVGLSVLCEWAYEGRILPGSKVSQDGDYWITAVNIPVLEEFWVNGSFGHTEKFKKPNGDINIKAHFEGHEQETKVITHILNQTGQRLVSLENQYKKLEIKEQKLGASINNLEKTLETSGKSVTEQVKLSKKGKFENISNSELKLIRNWSNNKKSAFDL